MDTTETINPRHLREKYKDWVGKRVNVGLTTMHYICGTWTSLDASEAWFKIGAHNYRVNIAEIITISEAPAWQAEFFK